MMSKRLIILLIVALLCQMLISLFHLTGNLATWLNVLSVLILALTIFVGVKDYLDNLGKKEDKNNEK